MKRECDDKELITEACQGNEQAFRRLVECNKDKLFSSMMRMLGCREDAEEAVQEAFVRVFLRIEDFNGNSKFSTWLHRIAFNSAISSRRKKRPSVSLDRQMETYVNEAIDHDACDVDAGLLRDEQIALLHRALDELSDDHRAILVLREMDDLAYEEIGKLLNISAGTVRSRLSRARGRLRDAINAIQASVANEGNGEQPLRQIS